jgi:flagellar basal-body rod modification protein FlgD
MQIGSTSSTTSALQNGGTIKTQSQQGQLGIDDFFTLMAAQLKNQDPSNPTDTTQYMGQMAQFSSLEQLTNISNSLNFAAASSVVGKNVEYSHSNSQTGQTETGTGLVSSVDVSGSSPTCIINGNTFKVSEITNILASDGTSAAVNASTNTGTSSGTQSTSMSLANTATELQLSNLMSAMQLMGNDSSTTAQDTQDSLFGGSVSNTPML